MCSGQSGEVLALGASLGPPALVPREQSSSLNRPLEPHRRRGLRGFGGEASGYGKTVAAPDCGQQAPLETKLETERRNLIKLGFRGAELGAGS